MRKILIPTDFSNEANVALDFATELAKKNKFFIKLVHVYEYPMATAYTSLDVGGPDPIESKFAAEAMKKNKSLLEKLVQKVQESGVQVESELKVGNPFINVSNELESEGYELVIMGSKGATGLEEILVGSNTEKVVRHAKCPVICLKTAVHVEDIKSIVFASNFKKVDNNLIRHLKQLQELFEAKIHFVRVNSLNNFEPDVYAKKRMHAWMKDQLFDNYDVRIYNDIGEEDGIIHYAEEIGADMLALGTHGRTGFGHLFSGSLAEDVVNHAKRPIWTYHIN
jgi:nucleotide-binding universal stress UspA family protein